MSGLTLIQFKLKITAEAQDIENRLDRGQNTPENIQRLEQINEIMEIISRNEKADSMYKKSMIK